MRTLTLTRALFLLLPLLAVLSAASFAAEGTKDDFQKFATEVITAAKAGDKAKLGPITKALVIPNSAAWFKKVFGDDTGAKLSAEYATQEAALPVQLEALLITTAQEGKTEVAVEMFDKAGDARATGLQNEALGAMKAPVPLFSVRYTKPGEPKGMHLWSFVFVDGTFRLAGKMKALKP